MPSLHKLIDSWLTVSGTLGRRLSRRTALLTAATFVVSAALVAPAAADGSKHDEPNWIGTWTASPQAPDGAALPVQFENQTLRQIVRTSIGGSVVRIRVSNEFGKTPLVVGGASIARHASGAAIVAGSERQLTFSGQPSITIPAGAPALSDPVRLDVPALGDLAISLYLPDASPAYSAHSLGLNTTYISPAGDYRDAIVMPTAATALSWYFLTGVAVTAPKRSEAIVAIGDSITDGYASTPDANARWPNVLAARLQARRNLDHLAVLNHGISGNRTQFDLVGPNAQARFDRDVLNAPGVKYVIVLEGINDIGIPGAFGLTSQQVSAERIISGYRQLIARAHEKGLLIFGGTLTPFAGTIFPGYYTPEGEAKRQTINAWIRSSGEYDAVIDFDKAIRDPSHPTRMLPAYDSGDHLHPNDAGYLAMGTAIDLSLFKRRGND